MKEKIYTIPVTDALNEDTECAVCFMIDKIEERALNSLVGPDNSYMQGDIREKTDEVGFCDKHFKALFKCNNTLGLALMVETHMVKVNKQYPKVLDSIRKPIKKNILTKPTVKGTSLSEYTDKKIHSCYICESVDALFPMYMDTFIKLWKEQDEIKQKVKDGKGFCLRHFESTADAAAARLGDKDYAKFCEDIIAAQKRSFKRVQEEVSWFVQKFDYRFSDEPWGNSKDSVQRAIRKLVSTEVVK
jgi:hypothetical protein